MGDLFTLKRTYSIAFCLLMLCSLLVIVNIGTVFATEPGYTNIVEAYTTSAVTVDGKWGGTNGAEWADAWLEKQFPTGVNARWAYKMDSNSGAYLMSWLLEFHDTTNDAGDIWRICIDGSADGGPAPNSNDHKIEIIGHTTLNVYIGNGTGWSPQTTTAVTWNNSLTTSPYDAVNHWVLEVQANKGALGEWGANPPPHGVYVGMYDASNTTQGWVQWPATTPDNPSRWGLIATYQESIPEGLNIGIAVLLTSFAVIVGSYYLRKRPKTTILPSPKL